MATTTYKQGTVSVSTGSATVTGSGTAWSTADLLPNMSFSVVLPSPATPIDIALGIQSIDSDTEITLTVPWTGDNLTDVNYEIVRDMTGLGFLIPQRGDMAPFGVIGETFRRIQNVLANFVAPWGSITGTLSDQTDLANALDSAAGTATWGDIGGDVADQTDLASVASSGAYADLSGTPVLGTAASADADDFAPAEAGIPAGGTIGQALIKASGTDFDTGWGDLPIIPLTISPLTAADASGLSWEEENSQAVGATSYFTMFEKIGSFEMLSCVVYGHRCGVRLTIDSEVIFDRTTDAIGESVPNTGNNSMFTSFHIPPARCESNIKVEIYNIAATSRNYGARALFRAL